MRCHTVHCGVKKLPISLLVKEMLGKFGDLTPERLIPLKFGQLFIKLLQQKAFYYLPWHGIESTLLDISFNATVAEIQSSELKVPEPVLYGV